MEENIIDETSLKEAYKKAKATAAKESKNRTLYELMLAVAIGVISNTYFNWYYLFSFIAIYAAIKGLYVYYLTIRINPPANFSKDDKEELLKEDTKTQEKLTKLNQIGIALSQGFMQFLLSFVILSLIASIVKLIVSFFL